MSAKINYGIANGLGDVTAAANVTDNAVVRGDGGGKGVQSSATALDDSGNLTTANATAIPAGGTAGAGYKFSSTSNFGIFFGSGAPTLSAAKGSLYLRSDGSGVGDRIYVNTDGSTAWAAITTAS